MSTPAADPLEVGPSNTGIQTTVSTLEDKYTALRRFNDLYSSARLLPLEILSYIFGHFCTPHYHRPDSDPRWLRRYYPTLTLGHICSQWRSVTWSTPSLWTEIAIDLHAGLAQGVAGLVDLYMCNVGGLPISVKIEFLKTYFGDMRTYGPISGSELRSIGAVFSKDEYTRKIRSLCLVRPPERWLASISTSFTNLEHISLEEAPTPTLDISLAPLPRLRSVFLRNDYGGNEPASLYINFQFSSLTTLELSSQPIDACVKFLIQCPNLVEFSSKTPGTASVEVPNPISPHSPIILHSLHKFHWCYRPSAWCSVVFHRIRLPALHTLEWDGGDIQLVSNENPEPAILALFSHFPKSFTTLTFTNISLSPIFLIRRVLSLCDSVRTLNLRGLDNDETFVILSVLSPDPEYNITNMPSLELLTISRVGQDEPMDSSVCSQIVEVLETRVSGSGIHFGMKIYQGGAADGEDPEDWEGMVFWDEGVRERLDKMAQYGLPLEIIETRIGG